MTNLFWSGITCGFHLHAPWCPWCAYCCSLSISVVEPEVFKAPGIVDTIRHRHQPFDLRPRAIGVLQIEQDRAGVVLGQLALDLPHQPLALLNIGFGRLPSDQVVDLGVAIAGVVALRAAHVVFVQYRIGIVDLGFRNVESDAVVLAVSIGYHWVVSIGFSSPSMYTCLSWSIMITAGSR